MDGRTHAGIGGAGGQTVGSMPGGTGRERPPQADQGAQRETMLLDVVRQLDTANTRLHRAIVRITDFRNRVYPATPRDEAQDKQLRDNDDTLAGAIHARLGQLQELCEWADQLAEDCEKIG